MGAVSPSDAHLEAVGRRVRQVVGGHRLASVEPVTTADGRPLVIDLNLRPWGPFLAWRETGLDLVAGRLAALGRSGPRSLARTVPAGRHVDVHPSASQLIVQEHLLGGGRHHLRESMKEARRVGPRQVLMTTVAPATSVLIGEPASGGREGRVGGLRRRGRQGAQVGAGTVRG